MRFGPVPLPEAEGAILAHSMALDGRRLRKGLILDRSHLAALAAAGHDAVTVARLDPGDMGEDAAAAALAEAIAGEGLAVGPAATGRVNLRADAPGIVAVDAARIDAANAVHPAVTVATVRRWQRLDARGLAATIKIIPYGAPRPAVDRACDAARGAMRLCPAILRRAQLIQTVVPGDDGARGHEALATRLDRLGVALAAKSVVEHAPEPLARALAEAEADILFVLTGSATSDPGDVGPEALRIAGGEVAHFGMPVDPGNLLFLGALGATPVIGLPGCARSPALNGADWVLERVVCGVAVTARDIMGMGVGGLLKESPVRGRPREAPGG